MQNLRGEPAAAAQSAEIAFRRADREASRPSGPAPAFALDKIQKRKLANPQHGQSKRKIVRLNQDNAAIDTSVSNL